MIKKILTFILLVGITFSSASAAVISSNTQAQSINIPKEVEKIVPQADLVKVVCYEAKWRGGQAISKVKAINEALKPILEEVRGIGVEISPDVFSVTSPHINALNKKIDNICGATTLDQVRERAYGFIQSANELRKSIKIELAGKLRAKLEPAMRAMEAEIREKLKKEIKEEAMKEAKEIENRIRAQEKEEVTRKKDEIFKRIKSQIERQLKEEFKRRMNPNGNNNALISELREKGPILGRKFGAEEGKKLKAEIEKKYKGFIEEEKRRLKKKYKEKGEKLGGEKRKRMEKIGEELENFEKTVSTVIAKTNNSEYQEYKQKAEDLKRRIISKTIDYYFDSAERIIEQQRPLIEAAIKEKNRISSKYPMKSVEDYKKELEIDRNIIINELLGKTEKHRTINQIKKDFIAKWEKIRKEMEAVKMLASQDVIRMIKKKVNWDSVLKKLSEWQKFTERINKEYQKDFLSCKNGKQNCVVCPLLNDRKKMIDVAVKINKNIFSAKKLIEKIDIYSSKTVSLEEQIKLKDDLQMILGTIRNEKNEFISLYSSYNNLVRSRVKSCAK